MKIVIVGVRFGGEFVPIYLNHPLIERVGLCDTNPQCIKEMTERYGEVFDLYENFDEVLKDENVDCVHILTPPALHAEMSVKALNSGKNVACAVTMGTSLEQIRRVVEAVRTSGKNYTMMETAVYTRNFRYTKHMQDTGELGEIQYLKSEYYQDVEGLQEHWIGYPPMCYATHSIAPLVFFAKSRVEEIYCVGSGTICEDMKKRYGNPFAVESALLRFGNGLRAGVVRSFNGVAKEYIEQFDVYGTKATFEWQQVNAIEKPVIYKIAPSYRDETGRYRRRNVQTVLFTPRDLPSDLPERIKPYLHENKYEAKGTKGKFFREGGDHHGAHPYIVDEFLRSIAENRKSFCDELTAANICAAGILAHQSAMNGGVAIKVPLF